MIRFTLTFLLPFAACYDTGVFSIERMEGDGSSIYGIEAEVLDDKEGMLYYTDVREKYVPPAPEMVRVTLAPGATSVRCTIFGDSIPNYREAKFEIIPYVPELTIRVEDTRIALSWNKVGGDFWILETKTSDGWVPSPCTVSATDAVSFFRLNRKLTR